MEVNKKFEHAATPRTRILPGEFRQANPQADSCRGSLSPQSFLVAMERLAKPPQMVLRSKHETWNEPEGGNWSRTGSHQLDDFSLSFFPVVPTHSLAERLQDENKSGVHRNPIGPYRS